MRSCGMSFGEALVTWFERAARPLPWRTDVRDAYATLVSEVMAQQTQIDRVVPKFSAFVARWPTLAALASADPDEVLEEWSGLGYYRRARMLHRLAAEVVDVHGGELPESVEELRRLPGIGEYTAAAIASMVHDQPVPLVDGNVRRVALRQMARQGDGRDRASVEAVKSWVRGLYEKHRPAVVNEALMELGATVCTPANPRCDRCPGASDCRAFRKGLVDDIPQARRARSIEVLRWVAACLVRSDGRWLLRKIDRGPILKGLWLPPFENRPVSEPIADLAVALAPEGVRARPERVGEVVRHSITFRRIEVTPVLLSVSGEPQAAALWQWAHPEAPKGGTSTLLKKLYNVFPNKELEAERMK